MNERAVFTPMEVAEYLDLSKPMVYRLCNQADFPAIRIGRSIKIPKAALDRWMEERAINKGEHA